jgi:DNA helicase-2/ATP-dependent DNA helicase PcrA
MSSFLAQPGVTHFFEEHGPSISYASASSLTTTLRRDAPSEEDIRRGKKTVDREEDNYWPLNGEEAAEEFAKWDYGKAINALPAFGTTRPASWINARMMAVQQEQDSSSAPTTMITGFVSVKAKYEELAERSRLNAIDKSAEARKKPDVEAAPKGRKRQIEGQGSITGFFAKRQQKSAIPTQYSSVSDTFSKPFDEALQPLRDITNKGQTNDSDVVLHKPPFSTSYKPRTAPLRPTTSFTSVTEPPEKGYLFLSSSPPQPESDENKLPDAVPREEAEGAGRLVGAAFKPATTFHTTSMQSLSQTAPRGKRYGVRPSFNGWANRGRK